MASIEPNWTGLTMFATAWIVACLALLTLVGMLPLRARPSGTAGGFGAALVLGNLALLALLACEAIVYAYTSIRWSSAIVAGGLIFLFAPALFQVCPESWRDRVSGLVLLGIAQACAIVAVAAAQRWI